MSRLDRITAAVTTRGDRYYYRVHPKGEIGDVLVSGLGSYSPGQMPGSYADYPDLDRWADQDYTLDPQTHRLYVADTEWENLAPDRFRVRIPSHHLESYDLRKDHLGDYYIDTGEDPETLLQPHQFDIDLGGGQWVRADRVDPIMVRSWEHLHHKPPGYYGNRFNEDEEDDEWV